MLAIGVVLRPSSFGRLLYVAAAMAAMQTHASNLAPLTLTDAEELALSGLPLLDAQRAAIAAARAQAVVDRQLPDPKLVTALQDLPINGESAFTLDEDDFTMLKAGVRQEFPVPEKRRLRGRRGEIEVDERELELATAEREVRRDVALAWLDVYQLEQSLVPTRRLADEYATQEGAAEIAVRTNAGRQSELFATRVARGFAHDRMRALERDLERARAALSRYIGSDALRPLSDALPELAEPPPLERLLDVSRAHPHLDRYAARVRLAENDIALAEQDYKPDWALSVEYGYRREFPDFVGVEVEWGLPLFRGQRQDRRVEASAALAEQMRAMQADVLRQHEADVRSAYADWRAARDRLAELDLTILPAAGLRVEAARSNYGSASGGLAEVLLARRELLEAELRHLEQRVEVVRALGRLRFFTP